MGIIEVEGMEFYAYHGCFAEEQIVGNKFLVDLKMEADCSKPELSDNIADAVNYQVAYQIVKSEMEITSRLLEHVAQRILTKLLEKMSGIDVATVKVSKMNPPMGGEIRNVSVTLSKKRSDKH